MANIIDYLSWRGDVPLAHSPFNDVDSLVLSQLAYLEPERAGLGFETITMEDFAAALAPCADAFSSLMREDGMRLLELAASSARLGNTLICRYTHKTDESLEMQFAAMTFLLDDGTAFIAFRGTDNTMVGWKEDFNMSFQPSVPAQQEALEYLLAEAALHCGPLRVGGHSKGGNLAVFAAAFAPEDVQDRVMCVWSHDGPGMNDDTFKKQGYLRILGKIRSVVPDFSIVGMLLIEHPGYMVVRSSATGLLQHDPFTWQVSREGFITAEALNPVCARLDDVLDDWLAGVSPAERKELVDIVFSVFDGAKGGLYEEMRGNTLRHAFSMILAMRRLDPDTRRQLRDLVAGLIGSSFEKA